jgi:hypothetical protein
MKVTRLLLKSCAAQSIGRDACLLVTYIASTEDACRYQYAVRFWNNQLDAVLDFKSRKQLAIVRDKAIQAGWLHYQREHDRAVGEYWTMVPAYVQRFDDSPVEDSRSASGSQTDVSCSASGSQTENSCSAGGARSGSGSGSRNGSPSIPSPVPDPKEENIPGIVPAVLAGSASDSDKPKAKPKRTKPAPLPAPGFDQFWAAYPIRKAKQRAAKAYIRAVQTVTAERGVDSTAAASVILNAAGRYASECRASGTNFIKHPATWLNDGCWEDELDTAAGRSSLPASYRGMKCIN